MGSLALFWVLGYNVEWYLDLFGERENILIRLMLRWIPESCLFATVFMICFWTLEKFKLHPSRLIKRLPAQSIYIIVFGCLLLSWLSALLDNLPGILLGDSYNQIYQALDMENLSTHHPITITLFIKLCLNATKTIRTGIIIKGIILAILAIHCFLMIRQQRDCRIIVFTMILYMFSPPIKFFSLLLTRI